MNTLAKPRTRCSIGSAGAFAILVGSVAFLSLAQANGPSRCPDTYADLYAEIGAAKSVESKVADAVRRAALRSQSRVEALQKEVAMAYGEKGEALIAAVKREVSGGIAKRLEGKEVDPIISNANGGAFDAESMRRELEKLRIEIMMSISSDDGQVMRRADNLDQALADYDSVIKARQEHPELTEAAEFLNGILQSKDVVQSFSEESILRALLVGNRNPEARAFAETWLADPNSTFVRPWNGDIVTALVSQGMRDGWRGATDIRPGVDFMKASIQQKRLPRDIAYRKSSHTQDAHLFQLVLATRVLTEQYGSEKAWKLISFLGTQEGQGYWNFLIDRGPGHRSDLRGPAFMGAHRGLKEVLGLE